MTYLFSYTFDQTCSIRLYLHVTTSFSESDLYMCLHEDAREKSFHIIGEDITITKINDINYGFILHTGIGPFSEMGGFFKKYWDKPSPPSNLYYRSLEKDNQISVYL